MLEKISYAKGHLIKNELSFSSCVRPSNEGHLNTPAKRNAEMPAAVMQKL